MLNRLITYILKTLSTNRHRLINGYNEYINYNLINKLY
jgi:hypothetical protein